MVVLTHPFVLFDIFRWENMEINVKTVDLKWTLKSSQSIDRNRALDSIMHTPLHTVYTYMWYGLWFCVCAFSLSLSLHVERFIREYTSTMHDRIHREYKHITIQLIRMLFGFGNVRCCGLQLEIHFERFEWAEHIAHAVRVWVSVCRKCTTLLLHNIHFHCNHNIISKLLCAHCVSTIWLEMKKKLSLGKKAIIPYKWYNVHGFGLYSWMRQCNAYIADICMYG